MVSAVRLCSEIPDSARALGLPARGVTRGAAQAPEVTARRAGPRAGVTATAQLLPAPDLPRRLLFTSLRPAPTVAGPPRGRSTIGRAACQSPGTFPGVGRPCPQHFLVRSAVPLPGPGTRRVLKGRTVAAAENPSLHPWLDAEGEGGVSPGPQPQPRGRHGRA